MSRYYPTPPFWSRALYKLGFSGLAWTMRKFTMPVAKGDLVLEVGAGDHPFPRTDIIVEKSEDSTEQERWGHLSGDRPTFLFKGEELPFGDRVFDFAIACQVLEHSSDPSLFLQELQRVAKRGYIETPHAVWERLAPMPFHVSEITECDGRLIINKKSAWNMDPVVEELWKRRLMWTKPVRKLTKQHPELFNITYFWSENIDFVVLNPETQAFEPPTWEAVKKRPIESRSPYGTGLDLLRFRMSRKAKIVLQNYISSAYRLSRKQIPYLPLLRCTSCNSTNLRNEVSLLVCPQCQNKYSVSGNYIRAY